MSGHYFKYLFALVFCAILTSEKSYAQDMWGSGFYQGGIQCPYQTSVARNAVSMTDGEREARQGIQTARSAQKQAQLKVRRNESKKEMLRESLNIPEGKKILLCVSKHSEREAPYDTIEAFHNLHNDNLFLLLVGDGPMHDLLIQWAKNFLIENICFAGYVPFVELPAYYSISDIFIHDSHNEPWGVSVQEAIACNVPVVVSEHVGSAVDLIEDGKNGYIFKTEDIVDLAQKIALAINLDADLLKEHNSELLKSWNYDVTYQNIIKVI